MASRLETVALALVLAVVATSCCRLSPREILRRLAPVNLFACMVLVVLPWSTAGAASSPDAATLLGSRGLYLGVQVAVKANAMVLWIIVLLGTLDFTTLGHALRHLRVPGKLVHLLLFTVRYVDVLHAEYLRLRMAMKLRGFRPRVSWHTYRSLGYLIGMLLVRSLDRSERILAAMKCRGFRGQFHLLDHFAFSMRDVWFVLVLSIVLGALGWGELR